MPDRESGSKLFNINYFPLDHFIQISYISQNRNIPDISIRLKTIMHPFLNKDLGAGYKSPSQKIRVLTEDWVGEEIFCPSCGAHINKYGNNRPVADFYCPTCEEDYEFKGKSRSFGRKIVDGAFDTALERLKGNLNPNLFLLAYNPQNYEVLNFCVIPKYFFVP
jgi:type II restriction enzyme